MVKGKTGVGRGVRWRNLFIAACAGVATLWTSAAYATITQGDFSVFGFFESREAGRWGEGSEVGLSAPATYKTVTGDAVSGITTLKGSQQITPGFPPGESGGSFDFNHWDLVEMRQLADVRPDYHIIKNYKLLGRFDTLVLKDADFFAFYRPWYDAFGTIKPHGDAQPDRDWTDYTQKQRQELYFRNDLREYYGQLNFTDNFSMRVGKQQVIWSEADAYSGTEITNPLDLKYHFIHFESAENLRKNLQMIKFNYILPDFLKTANNELEAFVIPGDYEGDGAVVNLSDARGPYAIRAANNGPDETHFVNQAGVPYRDNTFADQGEFPGVTVGPNLVQDDNELDGGRNGSGASNNFRRLWKLSEFGTRYSTLLPIGNGLQASFIYLYERRDTRFDVCTSCSTAEFAKNPAINPATGAHFPSIRLVPGVWYLPGFLSDGPPPAGDPVPFGTEKIWVSNQTPRHQFFGLTGTYYDKDLTDMVFRYDTFYAPKVGENVTPTHQVGNARAVRLGGNTGDSIDGSGRWTEEARGVLAGDRPTYIPWLSKQHTFLVAQYTATWYPDMPGHSINNIANASGKQRRWDDTFFLAATNWLVNGQLTTTNVVLWDADANDGFLTSTNVYRYSRNILLGVNAQWYIGRSGRFTDIADGIFSRNQRSNELEATFQYEI
jgi:hypothetical protein